MNAFIYLYLGLRICHADGYSSTYRTVHHYALLLFSFFGQPRLDLWYNRLGILETAILSDP